MGEGSTRGLKPMNYYDHVAKFQATFILHTGMTVSRTTIMDSAVASNFYERAKAVPRRKILKMTVQMQHCNCEPRQHSPLLPLQGLQQRKTRAVKLIAEPGC